jgi:NADPH:quinone reductase-like Zn-dependent oxidoreductase
MKALVLEQFNTPYKLINIDEPVPVSGQVLVKIHASGVNPLDLKICAGQAAHAQPKLPAILGVDMAGEVVSVGPGVTNFKPGDEVYGMTGGIAGIPGSLAQYAAVDAALIALKPQNLSMKQAAAVPLIFITAWEALNDRAKIQPGMNVLIHGGAGGVGHIAIQIALAKGATVFATGKPAHMQEIENYGAIPIDYTSTPLEKYVDIHTAGEGFDIILDTIGGNTLDDSFKAVKQYTGHVVSALGWGTHSLAPLSFHGATYSGVFTLYPLISGKKRQLHGEIMKIATGLIEQGLVKPKVDYKSYTLETTHDAYESIRNKTANGKVVIDIFNI